MIDDVLAIGAAIHRLMHGLIIGMMGIITLTGMFFCSEIAVVPM